MRRLLTPFVALVTALAVAAPAIAAGDPLRSHQWGLDMIHAEAWGCGCGREEKNAHIEPFSR